MTIRIREFFVISAAAIFLFLSIWIFGHRQLGGFDMSALIDTGWRIASGQTPYIDFPLTTPVIFYLGAGWAIKLWGAKWSAFVLAAAWMAVIAFFAQIAMLHRIISWKYSVAIALTCQMLCSMPTSYWWYNSVSVIAACLFFTAAFVFANHPTSRMSAFALWANLTFLSLTKPNIAGITALLTLIALLWLSPHRVRIIILYLAGLISFFLLLFILAINPLDVLRSYWEMSHGRGLPNLSWFFNDKPLEHLVTIPLFLLILLPVIAKIRQLKSVRQTLYGLKLQLAITGAVLLTGLFSMVSNSDSNLVIGTPFLVLGSSILLVYLPKENSTRFPCDLCIATIVVNLAAIWVGCAIMSGNHQLALVTAWYAGISVNGLLILLFMLFKNMRLLSNMSQFAKLTFNKVTWLVLLTCSIVAVYSGMMRLRVEAIGPERFFTTVPLVKIHNISFFENFWVSPHAQQVVDETKAVLQKKFGIPENWHTASVYFGPRIEFSYAAFDVNSPKDLPIWWHPNNSYADIYSVQFVRSFILHQFQVCIFLRTNGEPDSGPQPPQILQDITANYDRVDYPNITVFYRQDSP